MVNSYASELQTVVNEPIYNDNSYFMNNFKARRSYAFSLQ